MITPLTFVIDIDSLFALARRLDHRAIRVDDRFLEESVRLLTPDFKPRMVKRFHQQVDRDSAEPPAEIACGRRIWNALSAYRIQIGFVVSQQLQMLQTGSSGKQVIGDVQHMIGLGIGQIDLEQVQRLIDHLVQCELANHLMDQADPACGDGFRAIGYLVIDIRSRDHGAFAAHLAFIQTFLNSSLACLELSSYLGVHSKTLRAVRELNVLLIQ